MAKAKAKSVNVRAKTTVMSPADRASVSKTPRRAAKRPELRILQQRLDAMSSTELRELLNGLAEPRLLRLRKAIDRQLAQCQKRALAAKKSELAKLQREVEALEASLQS